jgi:phospholipase/carboxylesterase
VNTFTIDSARVRWSVPLTRIGAELASRPLLVLLHGYGSNADDLFGLVDYLPERCVVASIEAPLPVGPGWAWYNLAPDPETGGFKRDLDEINSCTMALSRWFESLEASFGQLQGLSLLGFSQGGSMAIQLLRRMPSAIDSVVLLASFVTEDHSPETQVLDQWLSEIKPPVFWGRDPRDPVVGENLIAYTRKWLPEHTTLEERLYANVGHSLSIEELEDVKAFLDAH